MANLLPTDHSDQLCRGAVAGDPVEAHRTARSHTTVELWIHWDALHALFLRAFQRTTVTISIWFHLIKFDLHQWVAM